MDSSLADGLPAVAEGLCIARLSPRSLRGTDAVVCRDSRKNLFENFHQVDWWSSFRRRAFGPEENFVTGATRKDRVLQMTSNVLLCNISQQQLKIFSSLVKCYSKIGQYMHFETTESSLTLRTLNDAKSAFTSFSLPPAFFDSFETNPSSNLKCKVLLKVWFFFFLLVHFFRLCCRSHFRPCSGAYRMWNRCGSASTITMLA